MPSEHRCPICKGELNEKGFCKKCLAGVVVARPIPPPPKKVEQEILPWKSIQKCPKCEYNAESWNRMECIYCAGPPECIEVVCKRCGYSWRERCADAGKDA